MENPICRTCGCDTISGSATIYWNTHKQEMETGDWSTDNWWCGTCETDTRWDFKPFDQWHLFPDEEDMYYDESN